LDLVQFLVEKCGVKRSPRDRWGATPLDDAGSSEVREYLESIGGEKGHTQTTY
jgi:hypothetical protein